MPRSALLHGAIAGLAVLTAACNPGAMTRHAPQTPHDRYARALRDAGLDSTTLGRDWLAASDSALRSPLTVRLPARELGMYVRHEARAVAYRFQLHRGERLRATLRADGLPARVFVDLYEVIADSARGFVHQVSGAPAAAVDSAAAVVELSYEAARDVQLVLRLQPELLRSGRFTLTLQSGPTLTFPVQARGNGAIQSLFGVGREGGRRVHHGIDIFAPRGTPVLAATDGTVRSIEPNELGGNVVWQSDRHRGQTLYYAHLDRHHVVAGQAVRAGDTLGFVGNSGNARTTPPHLHFGIYRRGEGPVDPLHYVRINTAVLPMLALDSADVGRWAVTRRSDVAVRSGVSDSSAVLRRIPRATRVQIVGASARMFRIQLDDGVSGYVSDASISVSQR